jgi:hypothetical protein
MPSKRTTGDQPIEPRPEHWREIEKALGSAFDVQQREPFRRDLCRLFWRYDPPQVRTANVERALKALHRNATRLYLDLAPDGRRIPQADESFEAALEERPVVCDPAKIRASGLSDKDRWALTYLSLDLLPSEKRRLLLNGLADLIEAINQRDCALLTDEGGQEPDLWLVNAIHDLAALYRHYTGKKPGKGMGPFQRFVMACLDAFAPETEKSDEAVVKDIQRALNGTWVLGASR